eukprot:TRINITY_DN25648_c0_g1_i2.p2 TRINITY_DN25648_c0_g1~~TRINITY_DN25648_c0_g1_i2.p2  ORF type:complete len:160 (-),score=1.21 TRINITY_DN25648_c0_g1_i2:668-1147(-)
MWFPTIMIWLISICIGGHRWIQWYHDNFSFVERLQNNIITNANGLQYRFIRINIIFILMGLSLKVARIRDKLLGLTSEEKATKIAYTAQEAMDICESLAKKLGVDNRADVLVVVTREKLLNFMSLEEIEALDFQLVPALKEYYRSEKEQGKHRKVIYQD